MNRSLLLSFIALAGGVVSSSALKVISTFPRDNVSLPVNSTESISFDCIVTGGYGGWEINNHQLHPERKLEGINITLETDRTTLSLYKEGLDKFRCQELPIRCFVHTTDPIRISFGNYIYVIRYGIPPPPENLTLTPTSTLLSVQLSWQRPKSYHRLVPVNYTVTIVMMDSNEVVKNFTVVPGGTSGGSYTFSEISSKKCQLHEFRVSSVNGAGTSKPAVVNETIPITPNVDSISNSLMANTILDNKTQIRISFEPATSCNPTTFPVEKYIISIAGVQGSLTIAGDQSDTITILLTSTDFPGLDSDSEYTIFVQACAWFACQTAMPATLVTSDVQSANITFLNTTVSLYCVFADSGSARGCRFILSLADGTREEVDIPRPTAGGTVTLECAYTNNRREAYTNIAVYDWESDGTTGSLIINPHIGEAVNEEDILPCVPLSTDVKIDIIKEDTGLSDGEVATIITVILVTMAVVVLGLIVAVWWKRKSISSTVENLVHPLSESEGINIRVERKEDKPTIMMLMKNLVPVQEKPTVMELIRSLSSASAPATHSEDKITLCENEQTPSPPPTASCKDPVASIKVNDPSDPSSLRLMLNPATLAHVMRVWEASPVKEKELNLYCSLEED